MTTVCGEITFSFLNRNSRSLPGSSKPALSLPSSSLLSSPTSTFKAPTLSAAAPTEESGWDRFSSTTSSVADIVTCMSAPDPEQNETMMNGTIEDIEDYDRCHTARYYHQQHRNNNTQAKKSVRFRIPVAPDFVPYEIILTEDIIQTLWWKEQDYRVFKRDSAIIAACHAQKAIPRLRRVYVNCSDSVRKQGGFNDDEMLDTMRELIYLSWANSRGLESMAFRAISQNRRSTIRALIWTQSKLPAEFDPIRQQESLAAISLRMSQQSRQIATAFGCADAVVARQLHRSH